MLKNEDIKYDNIESVVIEIFTKYNPSYYSSNLSKIMEKIFVATNKNSGITTGDNEYYRKSGAIPDRVYYIYSKQLKELDESKLYDIVLFKNNSCIWFYPDNIINMIEKKPIQTLSAIYDILIGVFSNSNTFVNSNYYNFITIENRILKIVFIIRILNFISITYTNIISAKDSKEELYDIIDTIHPYYYYTDNNNFYTYESKNKFIDDIIDNSSYETYISQKEYLNSYMLLEEGEDSKDD